MKIIKYFLLFFLIVIVNCTKGKKNLINENLGDTLIVYNIDEFFKIKQGTNNHKKIKVIDTLCINEEKRAIEDINKDKFVYYIFLGMTEMYRSNKEMAKLLLKYNVRLDSASTYCIPPPKEFKRNCYITVMNNEIEKKYGSKFIDSLRNIAEKQFVQNNLDIVYKFEECDTISRYPNTKNYSDFFDKPEEDFLKKFIYPKKYFYKKEKDFSSTDISFILKKNGTISIKEVYCDFANTKNEKYKDYFIKEATKFIKETKWIPATYKGITVNSEINFIHFHK